MDNYCVQLSGNQIVGPMPESDADKLMAYFISQDLYGKKRRMIDLTDFCTELKINLEK